MSKLPVAQRPSLAPALSPAALSLARLSPAESAASALVSIFPSLLASLLLPLPERRVPAIAGRAAGALAPSALRSWYAPAPRAFSELLFASSALSVAVRFAVMLMLVRLCTRLLKQRAVPAIADRRRIPEHLPSLLEVSCAHLSPQRI